MTLEGAGVGSGGVVVVEGTTEKPGGRNLALGDRRKEWRSVSAVSGKGYRRALS